MASSIFMRLFIVIVLLRMTEGRNLLRRHSPQHHRHHHRENDLEDSLPRRLPLNYQEQNIDKSLMDLGQKDDLEETLRLPVNEDNKFDLQGRDKRHNLRHANVRYKKMTVEDRRDFRNSVQRGIEENESINSFRNKRYDDDFELEVREAQNSSICNYTVVAIPDTRGNRITKNLEHVMCNHVGSRCQSVGTYCCIQTYRKVEVAYTDNSSEIMKIYAGCVCSLQLYDQFESPKLRLDD